LDGGAGKATQPYQLSPAGATGDHVWLRGASSNSVFFEQKERNMRIAQIAPLYESVPPHLYGGTERVVSYLTEELVRQGNDVTLFASGDSVTKAALVAPCERSLRLSPDCSDPLVHHAILYDQVLSRKDEFDILHFHTDYAHFPISKNLDLPVVTTVHGRLDIPDLLPLYRHFSSMPVVSISLAQRDPLDEVNWVGNVYHGLPAELHTLCNKPTDYLAFLGRISPEKRPDRAIRIAVRAGMKLKIAAKIDKVDREYFDSQIKPLLKRPGIEFVGEISESEKTAFLGDAQAYLFPIDWPEPFGLTMIEAMACGTPTIAFNCGSVPEVIEDGVTGYIVESEEEAVRALGRLHLLRRKTCREVFETRFSACRMAEDYLAIYRSLAKNRNHPTRRSSSETDILLVP
jgi:glycosyltransferase involved in cell wall biosynthesis